MQSLIASATSSSAPTEACESFRSPGSARTGRRSPRQRAEAVDPLNHERPAAPHASRARPRRSCWRAGGTAPAQRLLRRRSAAAPVRRADDVAVIRDRVGRSRSRWSWHLLVGVAPGAGASGSGDASPPSGNRRAVARGRRPRGRRRRPGRRRTGTTGRHRMRRCAHASGGLAHRVIRSAAAPIRARRLRTRRRSRGRQPSRPGAVPGDVPPVAVQQLDRGRERAQMTRNPARARPRRVPRAGPSAGRPTSTRRWPPPGR